MTTHRSRLFRLFLQNSIPIIIAILFLGGGASIVVLRAFRNLNYRQASAILQELNLYYENVLTEIDAQSLILSTSNEISTGLQYVMDNNYLSYENFIATQMLQDIFNATISTRPYIDSISVFIPNKYDLVFSDLGFQTVEGVYDQQWLETYNQSFSLQVIDFTTITPEKNEENIDIIRAIRPIVSTTGFIIGYIAVDIRVDSMVNAFLAFQNSNYSYLKVENSQGELLFSYPADYSDDGMIALFSAASDSYGWRYTLGIPEAVLFAPSITVLIYTLILSAAGLLVSLVIAYYTNKSEREFISNVITQLRSAGASSSIGESEEINGNIFEYLNDNIIKTFVENDYLKVQKEALEYRALQMQINPHFLFNTLDTIYWKTVKLTQGENDSSQMIYQLSNLLKYSLATNTGEGVYIGDEITQVKTYLNIQKARFRNKFTFEEHIERVPDIRIPSFTLQPIIENCFSHGFLEDEVLLITLSISENEEEILIAIEDNGTPIDEAKLERLNNPTIKALSSTSSIGIKNIRDRLNLFFQGKASLKIESDGIRGVSVTIRIERN